jgi:F-type H+-transporting ATPase subunit b
VRTRQLLAAGLLAAVFVLGAAGVAAAQEPTSAAPGQSPNLPTLEKKDQDIFECFEQERLKASPDWNSCYQSPSPIAPATNELIWGSASFVILFLAMWKLAFPALKKGMEGRTERIRADLARADEAKAEAEGVLVQYQQQLATAKHEATRVIEDARATADALKADLHKRAEAEIGEMRQRASADIEAAKVQAVADLRGEVAALAIGAAEVVVQKNLDHATQVSLVENYIATVGSRN